MASALIVILLYKSTASLSTMSDPNNKLPIQSTYHQVSQSIESWHQSSIPRSSTPLVANTRCLGSSNLPYWLHSTACHHNIAQDSLPLAMGASMDDRLQSAPQLQSSMGPKVPTASFLVMPLLPNERGRGSEQNLQQS